MGPTLALALAACECNPSLPPPPPDTTTTESTGATGTTGDTGPAPPCALPEVEPNGTLQTPDALALEVHACGTFDDTADLDYWAFTLEEDHWLEVELDTASGSIADPQLLVTPASGPWSAARLDDPNAVNARLVFPAPAGDYSVLAVDQLLRGGDRYGYTLLASEAKPPVSWTDEEVEPNDDVATAALVATGQVWYGTMDGDPALPGDHDYYEVVIPSGKHTLSFEVTAYDEGSPADLTIFLFDPALEALPHGCSSCAFKGGGGGERPDPVGEYDSAGDEIVYVQVQEKDDHEGPPYWYVLSFEVDAS